MITNGRIRKDFAKIRKVMEIPNLIDIQKKSYEGFLQRNCKPEERGDFGLQGVFRSVFPIRNFNETCSLEFVSYSLGDSKYDIDECRQREMTYAVPLKVVIRLVVWDVNQETSERNIRDVKEQEVYFGEIPLMTESGTFIINGTERVVVSQLHRSPGVFFDNDKLKTHSSGKIMYYARIIPNRGSWIDFEFDPKDILYVRIDRRRKFPATSLLKALGYSSKELIQYFYLTERITMKKDKILKAVGVELAVGDKASEDIVDSRTDEIIVKRGKKSPLPTSGKYERLQSSSFPSNMRTSLRK